MNYIDPAFDTPQPRPDEPWFFLRETTKTITIGDLLRDRADLAARLSRADATNAFLAEALRVVNDELAAVKSAIDKAPPGVADWLKAFGAYNTGQTDPSTAIDPAKPPDPRSEALGRAFSVSNRVLDGYGR